MFIGHVALGLAAKRITPKVSLAMLIFAAQWADTVWPLFLVFGIEHVRVDPGNTAVTPLDFISYPYSHSLAALLVWGIVVGVAYRVIAGGRRTVWVLGVLVLSHWLLDFVTHRPDMPLYPGSAKFGLGLWNSVPLTMIVESLLYAAGLWIYTRTTVPRDQVGHWGLIALASFLVVVWVANIFGPPPPNAMAIGIVAFFGALVLGLWAWWVDRHREIRR